MKKLAISVLSTALVLCALTTSVVSAEHDKYLGLVFHNVESFLADSLPGNAKWRLSLVSLKDKKMYSKEHAGGNMLMPASLMKLLVSAATLDANMRSLLNMNTTVGYSGEVKDGVLHGNLYIKGKGNALLKVEDFRPLFDGLVQAGIRVVDGDIVADESYFSIPLKTPDRSGPAYALPSALGMDLHTVSIERKAGGEVTISPENSGVRFAQGANINSSQVRHIDDLTYQVYGAGSYRRRISLNDPSFFAGGSIKTYLARLGIIINGKVRKGHAPLGIKVIAEIKAKPIEEIVSLTNRHSINVMAENMLLALGAKEYGAPGTKEKGIRALIAFLDRLGFERQSYEIWDASGLDPHNAAGGEFWAGFLLKVADEPWFESFYESLPMPGHEGTLKSVMVSGSVIKAKTARTEQVYGLAGYFDDAYSGRVAFSLVVNTEGADLLSGLTEPLLSRMSGVQ